jgi:predicted transposase YbfD/YdcC
VVSGVDLTVKVVCGYATVFQRGDVAMASRWPLLVSEYFQEITDPRRDLGKRHELLDVLILGLSGMLCGCEGWVDIVDYARAKQSWFETFLDLPNGIPSHDTFDRIFRLLDPDELSSALQKWLDSIAADIAEIKKEHVAIDGKTLRGSVDRVSGQLPWMMVSAWAVEHGVVLGQVAVKGEDGELHAIPPLLELLSLKGRIVTLDALGCQKEIAAKIREKEGDYVVSLKKNHPKLEEVVRQQFIEGLQNDFDGMKHERHDGTELKHGRLMRRCCDVLYDVATLPGIKEWTDIKAVVLMSTEQVRSINTANPKEEKGWRLFLSSVALPAEEMAQVIRRHWHVENQLHWQLDVHLNEDDSRLRRDNGPANLAMLRRLAITLGKRIDPKVSHRRKAKMAGYGDHYLIQLLTGQSTPEKKTSRKQLGK